MSKILGLDGQVLQTDEEAQEAPQQAQQRLNELENMLCGCTTQKLAQAFLGLHLVYGELVGRVMILSKAINDGASKGQMLTYLREISELSAAKSTAIIDRLTKKEEPN